MGRPIKPLQRTTHAGTSSTGQGGGSADANTITVIMIYNLGMFHSTLLNFIFGTLKPFQLSSCILYLRITIKVTLFIF